ncbi:hypothetical protein ACIQ57_21530 [Lysinibacillus xylanilyticus]|uniref:hypothetical protein n=1 Tax=Lysinibacillus xylanilyticus TaxID=582475 RepID=UPI00380DF6FD
MANGCLKKSRIITGIVLTLSILTYPLTLSLLHETSVIHDLDGTASLIVFHLLVSVGGIITIMAGIFIKTKPTEGNE